MTMPIDDAEDARRLTLQHYGIVDTPDEPEFRAIVQIVRVTLQAPIVLISLVDRDRLWFKARIGLDLAETPRDLSFCAHAVLRPDMLMIFDARQDERFADHPLVTGPPYVRFYAGAPLKARNGIRIGTLCAMDIVSRSDPSAGQIAAMERLAIETIEAMERRKVRLDAVAAPA